MKISKTLKLTLAASMIAGGISPAFGSDWTLLYDFEGESALDGLFATVSTVHHELQLHPDPWNPENTVFYPESGGYGVANHNTLHVAFEIPHIEPGETVTYYKRYLQAGPGNSYHWTFTPVEVAEISPGFWEPRVWGQFETIVRHGLPATPALVEMYNATMYQRLGTLDANDNFVPFVHVDGVWYEYWLVIVNDTDFLDDRYYLYVRGGQFTEITHLIVELLGSDGLPTGDYLDFAYFRNGTEQPLRTMTISTQSGWQDNPFAGDHFYVDDIYVADGIVLTSPIGDPDPVVIWNGHLVNDQGEADTGSLLGMIYVPSLDLNFGKSNDLERWIYIGPPTAVGGWFYVYAQGESNGNDWLGELVVPDSNGNWAYLVSQERWIYIAASDANGGWVHFRR